MSPKRTAIASTAELKKYNYLQVYQAIYNAGQTTRQAIAEQLGLSLPTVSQNLQELMDNGLIQRAGHLASTGGRRPYCIQAVADARLSVGLEILKEMAHIVVIDLYGTVLFEDFLPLNFHNTVAYFDSLCEWINEKINQLHCAKETVLGIGIAVQGLPSDDGSVLEFGKLLESGIHTDDFSRRLPWKCAMIHDVDLAARTELWFHHNITDAVYLSLNRNLGSSLIANGAIYVGNESYSSTIEHMCLIPDGRKCYCGKCGCVETYCSADALEKAAGQTLDQFFFRLRAGYEDERKIWHTYLQYLARTIDNVHMIIHGPILIGGLLQTYMIPEDFELLTELINEMTFFQTKSIQIEQSKCQNQATAIGAGLFYIECFLQTLE